MWGEPGRSMHKILCFSKKFLVCTTLKTRFTPQPLAFHNVKLFLTSKAFFGLSKMGIKSSVFSKMIDCPDSERINENYGGSGFSDP